MERNWQAEILACFAGVSDRDYANRASSGALLRLLDSTSGKDRTNLIREIGKTLQTNKNTKILGSLVELVTALDLAELHEAMINLATSGNFVNEPRMLQVIANYFATRKLCTR